MIHALKILPDYFRAILDGKKNFEVRKNDREFKAGDYLALNEYSEGMYTGRAVLMHVTYILSNAEYCKDGYVTMALDRCLVYNDTKFFDGRNKPEFVLTRGENDGRCD